MQIPVPLPGLVALQPQVSRRNDPIQWQIGIAVPLHLVLLNGRPTQRTGKEQRKNYKL
jgi:hypothetical protein